jgi:hypothetical protein
VITKGKGRIYSARMCAAFGRCVRARNEGRSAESYLHAQEAERLILNTRSTLWRKGRCREFVQIGRFRITRREDLKAIEIAITSHRIPSGEIPINIVRTIALNIYDALATGTDWWMRRKEGKREGSWTPYAQAISGERQIAELRARLEAYRRGEPETSSGAWANPATPLREKEET